MLKKLQIALIFILVCFIGYQIYLIFKPQQLSKLSNVNQYTILKKLVFKEIQEPKKETPKKTDFSKEFENLSKYLKEQDATYSVYINDLNNKKTYLYNEKQIYYAASLYKVPIGLYALKQVDDGKLSLEDKITYYPKDATFGTGHINESSYGTEYTINQLLSALFKDSDNTAQTMLSDKFDINSASMRGIFPNKGESSYYNTNESNILEIGEYLNQIYTKDLLSEKSKKIFFDLLTKTSFDKYIAENINGTFSHKIGLWGGYTHDCGVILEKNIVVCIMSSGASEQSFIKTAKKIAEFLNNI